MTQIVKIKKVVNLDDTFPERQDIVRDELGRIIGVDVFYQSVKIETRATYIGVSNNIDTYNRTIYDR